jgi:hypothetical protein
MSMALSRSRNVRLLSFSCMEVVDAVGVDLDCGGA